jgi:hypothetical protein
MPHLTRAARRRGGMALTRHADHCGTMDDPSTYGWGSRYW